MIFYLKPLSLILILLQLSTAALAQNSKYLIKAGKLFDSRSGKFLDMQAILINGNRITALKPIIALSEKEFQEYPLLIDLTNKAVLPGLIDAHTHLLHSEAVGQGSEMAMLKEILTESIAYRAIAGAEKAKAYLLSGITAVQDLGNSGRFADIALRKAIQDGLTVGPRMRCSGPGLAAIGGQIPDLLASQQELTKQEYQIITGVEQAISAVRENVNQGADLIKLYAENSPNKTSLNLQEMAAITSEAHRYGLRVTAHATSDLSIRNALLAGVDGIEHGYEVSDETLSMMAKKNVILVPTDGDTHTLLGWGKLAYPQDSLILEQNIKKFRSRFIDRLQRAVAKGVTIAMGSDDYHQLQMQPAEASKRVMIGYREAGLAIPLVLQTATINAARQLGLQTQIGQISPGFLADLIAVDQSIINDMTAILNVDFVMKDGYVHLKK